MTTFSQREYIVAGPPGCGKSTYVMSQAAKAVDKYGPDGVMICSLTKAAAAEIHRRNVTIDPHMVGTIHSHCFYGLGQPKLAETREGLRAWNDEHRNLTVGLDAASTEEDCGVREYKDESHKAPGTAFLQRVNLHRARCEPEQFWTIEERRFYKQWTEWKRDNDLYDFADLIEEATNRLPYAPGNPAVIFIDEAQDISRAEYELIRQWGGKCRMCVVVGDRDQSLYHWRGADKSVVDISRLPKERVRVLDQSYRVPRAVHAEAMRVIGMCRERVPVAYHPVDREGFCLRSATTIHNLDPVKEFIVSDKTVMILASCSYMLSDIITQLKDWGIPYGNPYTERWNPLGRRAMQLYVYLQASSEYHQDRARFWNAAEFKLLCKDMRAKGVFKRGRKKEIESLDDKLPAVELAQFIRDVFEPAALEEFMSLDPERFVRLYSERVNFDYPLSILRHSGVRALVDTPRVTVGTIHSVKGGEADIVIMYPDLSGKGYRQSRRAGWGGYDALIRMFYVGITRAKEGIIFGRSATEFYARI